MSLANRINTSQLDCKYYGSAVSRKIENAEADIRAYFSDAILFSVFIVLSWLRTLRMADGPYCPAYEAYFRRSFILPSFTLCILLSILINSSLALAFGTHPTSYALNSNIDWQ